MGCSASTAVPEAATQAAKPTAKPAAKAAASATKATPTAASSAAAPTKSLDFTISREFVVNASVDKCWGVAKDWELKYLVKYDSNVKVTVGEAAGKKTRTVQLAMGVIEESLESCDEGNKTIVYTMMKSFLPYSKHNVTLAVKPNPNDAAMCVLDWRSDIVALSDVDKSRSIAEKGLDGAILVFKKSLE